MDEENMSKQPNFDGPFPVKKGDWVAMKDTPSKVGIVKNVYLDPFMESDRNKFLVDVTMYNGSGDCVGRISPHCGGPKTFEPAMPWELFERIEKPYFPITVKRIQTGDGKSTLMLHHGSNVLPDGHFMKKIRRMAPLKFERTSDIDVTISALRLASEKLNQTLKVVPENARKDISDRIKEVDAEINDLMKPMS